MLTMHLAYLFMCNPCAPSSQLLYQWQIWMYWIEPCGTLLVIASQPKNDKFLLCSMCKPILNPCGISLHYVLLCVIISGVVLYG